MFDVDINGETYQAYADVDTADLYLAAALHGNADWAAATEDNKGRALVTMTRILDRQLWGQPYSTQALRFAEPNIQYACIEGALALIQGSDLQTEQSTAQKLESIRAGSVALTFFRGAEGPALRFPVIVWELLRWYLIGLGTGLAVNAVATGVSGASTRDPYEHTEGI